MRRRLNLLALSMVSIVAAPALADGDMPPLPTEPRTFASFAECRAFLDRTYKGDLRKADPAPVASDNGTAQTLIYSDGPKTDAPGHATYEVTEGWKNRTPLPQSGPVMTTYSYRKTQQRCDGGHLAGESITGYALEGYEPAPKPRGK